jgi:hypothetical protein
MPKDAGSTIPEREQLELEELRLRIRDLSAPWWKRPPVTAPLATIVAAILGLIWAVSTGFFDVTRRELAVSKRELQIQTTDLEAKRDRQSAAFEADSRKQRALIEQLKQQQVTLSRELKTLDTPVLVHVEWLRSGPTPEYQDSLELVIEGANLGEKQGTSRLSLSVWCPMKDTKSELGSLPATVDRWTTHKVRLVVKLPELKRMAIVAMPDSTARITCSTEILVVLRRFDGIQSNAKIAIISPGLL